MATPNGTTWTAAVNVLESTATVLNLAAKVGVGETNPAELVSAATGFVSAATALSEAPGMTTLSKISGLTSGIAALDTDIPALQAAITAKDASAIALDAVKVTADTCGTIAPLATGAAAVADANPATIGELGAPLTAVAAAADTCAVSSAALVTAVETGQTLLNSSAAIQQYLDKADTDIMNGFIDDAMDYLITGSAVGVPGSDLIANGTTLTAQTSSGAITTIGFNDSVSTEEFVGKGGSPVGASVTAYGGKTSTDGFGAVDSFFAEKTPDSTLLVDTPSSGSTVDAYNNPLETLTITGGFPSDTSAVEGVGTGSQINLDISNDILSGLSSGSTVAIEANTTLDKVEASGETVTIGNGADAVVDGTGNGVTVGTSATVDDAGTGNVITASDATVYVAAGDSVVVDGNDDQVVGAGSDHISDAGTGNNVFADNSTITFSGISTGDVVHGDDDSGTGWGGYVQTGGGYGGYGGGGYDAVVRASNLAAAQRISGRNVGSNATSMSSTASESSPNFMIDELRDSRAMDIASVADVSQEAAALYRVRPQLLRQQTTVQAASTAASLVQSMAAWGPPTSAFSTHEIESMRNAAPEWNGSFSTRTSIAHDLAVHNGLLR